MATTLRNGDKLCAAVGRSPSLSGGAGAAAEHAFIQPPPPPPACSGPSPESARATQYNNLGGGKGPAGLWSHSDFVKKLPCATGQSSTLEVTLNTRTSRSEKVAGFNHQLLEGMNGINALQLECVTPKSHVKLQKRRLATLDELKKTMFPPRRSQASEVEPQDVKSASCSSVASSVAARELLQFVCDCGSSEDVEFCGNAPSCSSLELNGDCSNESVGSTSSVT